MHVFLIMPIPVAPVDGIVAGIGVAVDIDAGEDGVEAVGGEKAAEERVVVAGVEILEAGFGVEALVDIGAAGENGGAVGGQGLAERAVVVAGGGDGAHQGDQAVGGEMVLDGPGGEAAVAADIGVEEAGQEAGRIGRIDAKLGVVAEIVDGGGAGRFADPLAVGAIDEAGGGACRDDRQGPVGGIVDQAAGGQGAGPVGIVGEGIAGRVIGDGTAADRGGGMGAATAQALAGGGAIAVRIDQVGVGGAQAGVPYQIVGVVIGEAAILGAAGGPVGEDQAAEAVIAIGPGPGRIGRGDGGDQAVRGAGCTGEKGISTSGELWITIVYLQSERFQEERDSIAYHDLVELECAARIPDAKSLK